MSGMHGNGAAWRHLRSDRSVVKNRIERGTVRRVFGFARPHRRLIATFLTLTVIDAGLVVVNPLLVQRIIDDGILGNDRGPGHGPGPGDGGRRRWSARCSPWGRAGSPPASVRA